MYLDLLDALDQAKLKLVEPKLPPGTVSTGDAPRYASAEITPADVVDAARYNDDVYLIKVSRPKGVVEALHRWGWAKLSSVLWALRCDPLEAADALARLEHFGGAGKVLRVSTAAATPK